MSQRVTTDTVRLDVTCLRVAFLEQNDKRGTGEMSPGGGL